MAVIGWALPMSDDGPERAQVTLRTIDCGHRPTVAATVRLEPREAVKDPEFMNVTAWQGGGSVVDPLEKVGPGVYRTTEPIPVYGGWKATVRIQRGDALASMPLFMPKDEAIPATEVPAKANSHARVPAGSRPAPARAQEGRVARTDRDCLPHRAGDRALASRADRVVAAARGPWRGPRAATRQDSARAGRTRVKQH